MNILVLIAHPDDETILTGGAAALLARAGADVHYLCATRGEGGEVGEPALCTQGELGQVREKEMRCAVQALGGKSTSFLEYIDPMIGENDALYPYTNDLDELTRRVIEHIGQIGPNAIITHGSSGEYGHPAHVLTHRAAVGAVENHGDAAPMLYTFNANFLGHPRARHLNADDPAHIVLDITPAFEQKINAALCHRSQSALFVRRSSIRAGRPMTIPEVLVKVEGLHRRYPQVNGQPDDEIIELLKPWMKKNV
ncbi:MAG: PIG-L family deacetylase [Anaerolineales bacterium]|nr:PIG-L family deacetylase [Chloroflexota bacterium]MBL6980634.1 PIG-L family deacetylase [Anaerolineales bacterium]